LDEVIGTQFSGEALGTVSGEKDFRSHLTEFEGLVYDGNTAGFISAEDGESGVQQFITVRRILTDGSGAPLSAPPTSSP
jgi:hypothetical protein